MDQHVFFLPFVCSSSSSNSSRDSGVFSTGGSSQLQQHQQHQQQLKMWDTAALKLGDVALDEGVVDVSV